MAADGDRWGGVGEGWRGAAEGEPSGPVISPSESEERRTLPPTLTDRAAAVALSLYCLFVVYGSFFPFHLTLQREAIRARLSTVIVRPFDAAGRRQFSIPDMASNVALGVPYGLLLVRSGLAGRSIPARSMAVLAFTVVFAGLVEAGQLLAPGRTASPLDVVAQVLGALLGAVGAHLSPRLLATARGRQVVLLLLREPALAVAVILAGVLAADALYPYAVTLDVSTVRQNIRTAQLVPFQGLGRRFWSDLIVDKVLPYAVLVLLLRRAAPGASLGTAGAIAVLLAGFLEGAKLLFVGRSPNVDYLILAALGAALGGAVLAPLLRLEGIRARAPGLLVLLAAALMVYEELAPFDFVASLEAARAKLLRLEWAPLASYYGADSKSAIFDLGKKLLLGGFLGAALAGWGRRGAWAWGLLLGAALEGLQVLQISHLPALTDAVSLGAGAGLGALALGRYRATRDRAIRTSRAQHPSSPRRGAVSSWEH